MKKVLLVLCAMFMIMGANAVEKPQHAAKKLPVKVQKGLVPIQKKELMKNLKAEKIAQHKKERADKLNKKSAQKKTAPIKKGGSEPVTITLDTMVIEYYGYDDYYNSYNYFFRLDGHGSDGNDYWISLDSYPLTKSRTGVFSTEDGTLDLWSAINNSTTGDSEWISEDLNSSFSVTLSEKEHYDIAGTLYGESGNEYILAGNVFYPDPSNYTMTGIKWKGSCMGDQYLGQLSTLDNAFFQLVFNLEEGQTDLEMGKEYTVSDMDKEYTGGYWNHKDIYIVEMSFTMTRDIETGDELITLKITTDKEDTYDIEYMTPKLPEKFNDVYMTANAVDLNDFSQSDDGVWQFLGVSEDGEWNLSIAAFSNHLIGEYAESDIYKDFTYIGMSDLTVDLTLDYGKIDNVKVVAGPNKDEYICTADLYCYNGNCYHLTLNRIRPEKKTTYTMTATNLKMMYDEFYDVNIVYANDDNYDFSVALPMVKTDFAAGELRPAIANHGSDEAFKIYDVQAFKIAYDEHGKPTKLDGSCLTKDGTEFIFDLSYVMPEPTRTENLTVTIANGELRPTDDGFTVIGYSDDETQYINLNVLSDDIAGTYKLLDVDEMDTYILEHADSYYDRVFLDPENLDVTVSVAMEDGKEIATISGTMLCVSQADYKDVPLYNLAIKVPVKRGLKMDAEDEDFTATYTTDDLKIVDMASEEGWILLQGTNADKKAFAMVFFADASDPAITIPAGEYEINSTQNVGTIFASPGISADGSSVQASYAATTNMLGFIETPWFMVKGKATVTNVSGVLTITVQALNSYNRNVLIGVNTEAPTGISSVMTDKVAKETRKVLVDKKIIIEHNGFRYNVQGQRVK